MKFFYFSIFSLFLIFMGCDTIRSIEIFGEWSYRNNEAGVTYSQTLLLNADLTYSWDYFEDETKDAVFSNGGTYSIVEDKNSLSINFTPSVEGDESLPFSCKFIVRDSGCTLDLVLQSVEVASQRVSFELKASAPAEDIPAETTPEVE